MRDFVTQTVTYATQDYPYRRGPVAYSDATSTTYSVSPPYTTALASPQTEEQFITTDSKTGYSLFSFVYRNYDGVAAIVEAITTIKGSGYAMKKELTKLPNGDLADTLYYKHIAVAILTLNADKTLGIVTIGVIDPSDRSAAMGTLPPSYCRPWPATKWTDHLSVAGSVIAVKGWGADFDGNYDAAKIASGDTCVSGDCSSGHGRKILASISASGVPDIRIMDGKFSHDIFTGDGVMLIDGEGPEVNGTYDISKQRINTKMNRYESKCVFHPKGSNEPVNGVFIAPERESFYDKNPDFKHYIVCTFLAKSGGDVPETAWERDVEYPFILWKNDAYTVSPKGRAEEIHRLQDNAEYDAIKQRNADNKKCSCCGGRGTIVNKSFNHAMGAGIGYMKYQDVPCNCCHGTGMANDQTEYKAKTDGGSHLDYKH